jgi:hypothetical protein
MQWVVPFFEQPASLIEKTITKKIEKLLQGDLLIDTKTVARLSAHVCTARGRRGEQKK